MISDYHAPKLPFDDSEGSGHNHAPDSSSSNGLDMNGSLEESLIEDDDEPDLKRQCVISTRERNKYKGMRIRQCLCGFSDCLPRLKGWIDLNDAKRQGFKELPRQSSKTTPVGMEKNRVRDIMFLHLKGCRSPKYDENDKTNRERKLFVAFHHFHPALLQEGNKGPYPYVSLELAEHVGGFSEADKVLNLSAVLFHPIPNYPRELAARDFEIAGGIRLQKYGRPRKLPSKTGKERMSSAVLQGRVREVLGQMERDPLQVANEYIRMQDRLQQDEHMETKNQISTCFKGELSSSKNDGAINSIEV